jgi:tRNA A37 threonylcarbamoyladenosine dehydratase
VFSTEPLRYPAGDNCAVPAGLNCAGFGSSVCVTSVFGMVAAARAIELITSGKAAR